MDNCPEGSTYNMRVTRFIVFGFSLLVALLLVVVVDPSSTAAILSAHPLEVVLIGTTFAIDPLDRVMTLAEWRVLRRISASTERRMRRAGLGPKLLHISAGQLGVRVRDDIEWMERGGASGAPASTADVPVARANTGRDTTKATAASVAKRAKRKAADDSSPSRAEYKSPPYEA